MNGMAVSRSPRVGDARCRPDRRAISETLSTVSSGENASKMRTARDSTDSPDPDRAISGT
jgi:hypothetical protein